MLLSQATSACQGGSGPGTSSEGHLATAYAYVQCVTQDAYYKPREDKVIVITAEPSGGELPEGEPGGGGGGDGFYVYLLPRVQLR